MCLIKEVYRDMSAVVLVLMYKSFFSVLCLQLAFFRWIFSIEWFS